MTSTYTHIGNINDIPDDAPPALHFLKSLMAALDGNDPAARASHISPNATVVTNGSEPLLFSALEPMFEQRAQVVSRFFHTLHRAWVIPTSDIPADRVTIFIDWSSTTEFKSAPGTLAVIAEFCIVDVVPIGEDDSEAVGVNGLRVERVQNWLDPGPVKDLQTKVGI